VAHSLLYPRVKAVNHKGTKAAKHTEKPKTFKGNVHMTPNQASHIVIGAAIRVHRALGPGLLESAYQSCLCYEFAKASLTFEHERYLPIIYDGIEIPAAYRVDFMVENCLIVEVKCVERILPVHHAQLLSYLKISGRKLGLLLNFNAPTMRDGVHRKINDLESELDKE
jgi:GxxExxY protein